MFMEKKQVIENVQYAKKEFEENMLKINHHDCLIILHSLLEASDNERGAIQRDILTGNKEMIYMGTLSNNQQQFMTIMKLLDVVVKSKNTIERNIDTVPIIETILITGDNIDEDSKNILNSKYDLNKVDVFFEEIGLYGGKIDAVRIFVILNPTKEISESFNKTMYVFRSFYKWHFYKTILMLNVELSGDTEDRLMVKNKTPNDILTSMKISSRTVVSENSLFPSWKPDIIEKIERTSNSSYQDRASPIHKKNLFQEFDATMNEYKKFPEIIETFQNKFEMSIDDYCKIWKALQIIAYQNNNKTVVYLTKSRLMVKIKKNTGISKKIIEKFLEKFTWKSGYSIIEKPLISDHVNLLYSWVTTEHAPHVPLEQIYHDVVNNDLKGKEFEEDCRDVFRNLQISVFDSRIDLYGEIIPFEESLKLWGRVKKRTDLDVIGIHKNVLFILECKARKNKKKKMKRFSNLFNKYHKELYFKTQWISLHFGEFKEITKKLGFEIPEEVKYIVPLFVSNLIEENSEFLTNNVSELKYILENTPQEFNDGVWKLKMNNSTLKIPLLQIS